MSEFLPPNHELEPDKEKKEKNPENLPLTFCNACEEKGDGCMYLNLQNNFAQPPEDQRIWFEELGCPYWIDNEGENPLIHED